MCICMCMYVHIHLVPYVCVSNTRHVFDMMRSADIYIYRHMYMHMFIYVYIHMYLLPYVCVSNTRACI